MTAFMIPVWQNTSAQARFFKVLPERGYPAAIYDTSVVGPLKSLRRQFGHFYDQKKIRNR